MNKYETFTILDPDLSEDGRKPVIEKITDLMGQEGGLLVLKDEWGARKLAYDIKKKSRGYYIRFEYCGTGPLVNEIERSCRIDDRVLKYMTVQMEKNADIDQIKKALEEAEAEKKAAAEAEAEKKAAAEAEAEKKAAAEAEAEKKAAAEAEAEKKAAEEAAAEAQPVESNPVYESAQTDDVPDEPEVKESQDDMEEQTNE